MNDENITRSNTLTGKFIVFEGIDSRVLTEQANHMARWLREQASASVVQTQEPTGGPIGTQIRLVLNGRLQVDDLTLATLYLADRLDHLHRGGDGIFVELENDRYVLCARYLLSAYAYASESVSFAWLYQINRLCPWPDLMLFIDTPVAQALHAWGEQEGWDAHIVEARKAKLYKIRERYLDVISRCQARGHSVAVVEGRAPAAVIHQVCRGLLVDLDLDLGLAEDDKS